MPPAVTPSNIRAFVHWRERTVYAGEEIECVITFKNVAPQPGEEEEDGTQTSLGNAHPPRERRPSHVASAAGSRRGSVVQQSRKLPGSSARGEPSARGHRPTLSLNIVSASSKGSAHKTSLVAKTPDGGIGGHGRSLSVMSLGSEIPSNGRSQTGAMAGKRPTKGHSRSASLQYVSKPQHHASPNVSTMLPRQPSPLYESITPPAMAEPESEPTPIRPGRRRPGTVSAGNTPQLGRQATMPKTFNGGGLNSTFQFPAQPSTKNASLHSDVPKPNRTPSTMHSGQHRTASPRPSEGWSGALNNLNPITRVMSESSTTGDTSRDSSEFYSISNNSEETLTSELANNYQEASRLQQHASNSRKGSQPRQGSGAKSAESETLMMGYVQTMGHFTLDGSLVNAAPFEEVKRKGVQGGGGVVGVERPKRSSSMFGAFGWGNIGESLGGLLGGDEMSSMAQMKATAGSKTIPLLSTPQSLLFVDLRLSPGESQSYSYRFALPRGLPPSHRGRAIKVNYHLALGIQRPDGRAVKHVPIPFRVLGSYNARGEMLGHDLMSPYILLQDAARTVSITPDPSKSMDYPEFASREALPRVKTPKQGLEDFLRYTERLLDRPTQTSNELLSPISPASPTVSRKGSLADPVPASVRETVDFAILRSNQAKPLGKQKPSEAPSSNRFNIARSGQPVAVLNLLRPTYRLGEAVTGVIDFTAPSPASGLPAQAPSYAVSVELESAERIDPSLALRSSHSIHRVTRKVHAALSEHAAFARQLSFELAIPAAATPSFETTGVSLAWRLRVEFTTRRQGPAAGLGIEPLAAPDDEALLEELGRDERGATFVAREHLVAEKFEIGIPLMVFGAPGVEGLAGETDALEV